MTTRALIIHGDGYPQEVMPDLLKIKDQVIKERRYPGYLARVLLSLSIAYDPTGNINDDIEYVYFYNYEREEPHIVIKRSLFVSIEDGKYVWFPEGVKQVIQ